MSLGAEFRIDWRGDSMMRECTSCLVVSGVRNVRILEMLRRWRLQDLDSSWMWGRKERWESRVTPRTLACGVGEMVA
ncbi:unnamed protein product, partial [Staurois parvus]